MQALVLTDYNHFEYKTVPLPKYGDADVLVRVKACGICGSDVHGMDGSSGRRIPPIIMGHEVSGEIAAVGKNITGCKEGDRVTIDSTIYSLDDWYTRKGMYNLSNDRMVLGVSCKEYRCDGAFAEYVVVPQQNIYRIPDAINFNQATLVEPASVALHAVKLSSIASYNIAVVVGAGIVGLLVIQMLKIYGCTRIIAVDIDHGRLDLACKLGAQMGLNPEFCNVSDEIHQLCENRGSDIAFEVVGKTETFNLALQSIRKGGTLILIGNLTGNVEIAIQKIVTNQIRVQGSCANCGEFPEVIKMMAQKKLNVDPLISASVPLAQGAKLFQKLYNEETNLLKVILNP
jgi:L-iditol 2-dehydrogenase